VYEDEDALAIYYARFTASHPEHPVKLAVGLGNWSEDAAPDERQSFALDLRAIESRHEVMVTDAAESPWKNAKVIGRMLDRAEALAHPRISRKAACDAELMHKPDGRRRARGKMTSAVACRLLCMR
jgi:hypothetical protein